MKKKRKNLNQIKKWSNTFYNNVKDSEQKTKKLGKPIQFTKILEK